jgi:2-polyprenyl-3-methyl-5-hydroxy-6-metoxy-1,4-benzoquinol methylase
MSQITTGIRSVLSSPKVYDTFQDLMGAKKVRRELVRMHVRAEKGMRILDIGCGTARILDHLPEVEYHGFDQSQTYIDEAVKRYGIRGNFNCALLEQATVDNLGQFDVVIATGLLHHLDDEQSLRLMQLAWSALKPGGRLVTNDPCFTENQNFISHFLVSRDRGQNVRKLNEYPLLAHSTFKNAIANVRHWAFIPYTRCTMECTK